MTGRWSHAMSTTSHLPVCASWIRSPERVRRGNSAQIEYGHSASRWRGSGDEPAELDAVWRAISAHDYKSHKLWTDDYLAAFAQASDATLITLDRKVPARYPSVRVELLLS